MCKRFGMLCRTAHVLPDMQSHIPYEPVFVHASFLIEPDVRGPKVYCTHVRWWLVST